MVAATAQTEVGAATPPLAETLSFKVSALTPGEVAKDLTKHGLQLSPSFIRGVAQQVGQIAVEKAATWKEALTKLKGESHCYPDKDNERQRDHDRSDFGVSLRLSTFMFTLV